MKSQLRKSLIFSPFALTLLLFVVLQSTSPDTVGPVGVLAVFVLIYLLALSLFFVVMHFGIAWFSRKIIARNDNLSRGELKIGVRKAYYVASVLAFAPVALLAMRSFGQLEPGDIVLVLALVGISVFYIVKRS